MPHRAVLLVSLLCLALVGTAVAPWTVSSNAMAEAVAEQLREVYGLDLRVDGRSTVAFLPVPRVKFEDVALSAADGAAVVRGGQLRGELRLLPLLTGRLELSELSLAGAHVAADATRPWSGPAERVRARLGEPSPPLHVRRLILTGATVALPGGGADAVLRNVDLLANWPRPDAPLDLIASFRWRDEPVRVTLTGLKPGGLLAGEPNRLSLAVDAPPGRLGFDGEVRGGADWRANGRSTFSTPSARDFLRWTGLGFPLGPLFAAVALDGEVSATRSGASWPSLSLTLGADRLDGALAARFDGPRPLLTGTLAAEGLDLSDEIGGLGPVRTGRGGWSGERLDLKGLTEALDLDLRLSATEARVGAVKLSDIAANLLVKAGRVEASLARAGLHRGGVKGRASLSHAAAGVDLRLQGSFDRVDMGALLADLGQARWLSGSGAGQVALEGAGASPAEFARQVHGRATVAVRGGEFVGASLLDTLRRVDRRPLSTVLDWKGGRTAFDHAHATLSVGNGAAEVTDGGFSSPALRGVLHGRASLTERSVTMKAEIARAEAPKADAARAYVAGPTPINPGASIGFDLVGSWDDVAVIPDVRALIERSDAAQQLLSEDARRPRREAAPVSAQ